MAYKGNDFHSKLRPSNSIRNDFRLPNSIHIDLQTWFASACRLSNSIRNDFQTRFISTFKLGLQVASSPGSPSPFLTFSRARILYAKNRRRGRAWYGTPPIRGHLAKVLVATRSFVHSTALALPSGPCLLH